ncbi:hypothetical protein V5O48_019574, partial [Marasmius crinis-equi]
VGLKGMSLNKVKTKKGGRNVNRTVQTNSMMEDAWKKYDSEQKAAAEAAAAGGAAAAGAGAEAPEAAAAGASAPTDETTPNPASGSQE